MESCPWFLKQNQIQVKQPEVVAVTEMSMVIRGPVSMETAPLEEFLLLPLFAAQLMTNWVIPVELIEIIRGGIFHKSYWW